MVQMICLVVQVIATIVLVLFVIRLGFILDTLDGIIVKSLNETVNVINAGNKTVSELQKHIMFDKSSRDSEYSDLKRTAEESKKIVGDLDMLLDKLKRSK